MLRTLDGPFAATRSEVKAQAPFRALFAGDLVGPGHARASLLERLAVRLRRIGDRVVTTSSRPGRFWQAADLFLTAWSARATVDVALVDVNGASGVRRAQLLIDHVFKAGVPVVLLLRGADLARAANDDPGPLRMLLDSCAASVALTGYLYEELAHVGVITHVIADPIEVNAFAHRARRSAAPHLLWVCNRARPDSMRHAVEVLRELAEAEPPDAGTTTRTHLTIVPSADRTAVRQALDLAESYGLRDRVSLGTPLRGTTSQELFAHNDVFVNDADVDRPTVSLAEAMAAGMCIVSTDFGGAGYLIGHGVDGLLVRRDEQGGVLSAVRRILQEPDLSERISLGARSKAETLDWSRALPRWRDLLTRVSAGGG